MIEKSQKGFTLVELIVSVAILSILATSVIIITNPAELMKQARDSRRISDLTALSTAISFYTNSVSPPNMDGVGNSTCKDGSNKKVYVSVPSNQTPPSNLPPGWSYGQTSETNLKKVNGTGWIPINFTSVIGGPPISALPIDPVNSFSKNLFYSYTCSSNGNFELTARFESKKYNLNGSNPQTVLDGGTDRTIYEVGSDLTLDPFSPVLELSFDEGTGTIAYDSSGNNNHGTLYNGPQWVDGKVGKALSFDGVDDYVETSPIQERSVSVWISLNNQQQAFFYDGGTPSTDRAYQIGVYKPNGVGGGSTFDTTFGLYLAFFANDVAIPYDAIKSGWHHVVVSWNGGTNVRISLDNQFLPGFVWDGTSWTSQNQPFTLPRIPSPDPNQSTLISRSRSYLWGTGSLYFPGLIDEVRIYNRALSPEEIKALYEATK